MAAGFFVIDGVVEQRRIEPYRYPPEKNQGLPLCATTPEKNWANWIRTNECRSQSPVPYRLAMAHYVLQPLSKFPYKKNASISAAF